MAFSLRSRSLHSSLSHSTALPLVPTSDDVARLSLPPTPQTALYLASYACHGRHQLCSPPHVASDEPQAKAKDPPTVCVQPDDLAVARILELICLQRAVCALAPGPHLRAPVRGPHGGFDTPA